MAVALSACGTSETSGNGGPGRIAYQTTRYGALDIVAIDASGKNFKRLTTHLGDDGWPTWSPDTLHIAFQSDRAPTTRFQIYVMNAADGTGPVNLTNNPATDWGPAWSRDGSKIAFYSNRELDFAIWVMNSDGSNPVRLTNPAIQAGLPDWSADNTRIAYEQDGHLWVMDADGSHKVQITSGRAVVDGVPRWRPVP